jgi:hypothetical protein
LYFPVGEKTNFVLLITRKYTFVFCTHPKIQILFYRSPENTNFVFFLTRKYKFVLSPENTNGRKYKFVFLNTIFVEKYKFCINNTVVLLLGYPKTLWPNEGSFRFMNF